VRSGEAAKVQSYGGNDVNRPAQLRQLPLHLYRSQNYPQQPGDVGRAAQGFLAGDQPPIYVPARMSYTKWTRLHSIFGANTVAMLAALRQSRERVEALQIAAMHGVPATSLHETANAITGNQLTSLRRLNLQNYSQDPGPKNGLPQSAFLDPAAILVAIQTNRPVM
jgi:hypothetical protein